VWGGLSETERRTLKHLQRKQNQSHISARGPSSSECVPPREPPDLVGERLDRDEDHESASSASRLAQTVQAARAGKRSAGLQRELQHETRSAESP
jgi:hypothetical protein